MNNIFINVFEQNDDGISFKNLIDNDYFIGENSKKEKYEILNKETNETFSYYFKDDLTKNFKELKEQQQQQQLENGDEINVLLFLNVVYNFDECYYTLNVIDKFKESILKNKIYKNKIVNLFIMVIQCEYIEGKFNSTFNKIERESIIFEEISKFKDELKSITNLQINLESINMVPFSLNAKYEIKYLVDLVENFYSTKISNDTKKLKLNEIQSEYLNFKTKIQDSTIQSIVISSKDSFKYEIVELYKQCSNIDFTSLKQLILQSNSFIDSTWEKNENIKVLNIISKVLSNTTISNWIEFDIFKRKGVNDGSSFLLGRVAQFGDLSLFKYILEQEVLENGNEQFKYDLLIKIDKHQGIYFGNFGNFNFSVISFIIEFNEQHSLEIINWLLQDKSMNKESQINWQTIALSAASFFNKLEIFKLILNHENCVVSVTSESKIHFNSIHFAAFNGSFDIIKYIYQELKFKEKDEIETRSSNKKISSIHLAASNLQKEVFDYLLSIYNRGNKFDINKCKDESGATSIYYAANSGSTHSIKEKEEFCNYLIIEYDSNSNCTINGENIDIFNDVLYKYNKKSSCTIL